MINKKIDKLIGILNQEYDYYQDLRELAADKKEMIIENEVEQLSEIIEEDEDIVKQLEQLEEERNQLISELGADYEIGKKQITFQDLQEHLPADKKQQLEDIRGQLLTVIEELDRKNDENRQLLEEAIKLNNFSFEMMSRVLEPESQTYNNKSEGDNPDKSNHIINRRA